MRASWPIVVRALVARSRRISAAQLVRRAADSAHSERTAWALVYGLPERGSRDLKTSRIGSRSSFQILADYYQAGDTRDRDLWHEYARATRGLSAVRWSRGLRAATLGRSAAVAETDEELAAEEVNGELLATIEAASWSRLRLAGLDLAVLVVAEQGGPAAAAALVPGIGLHWVWT